VRSRLSRGRDQLRRLMGIEEKLETQSANSAVMSPQDRRVA